VLAEKGTILPEDHEERQNTLFKRERILRKFIGAQGFSAFGSHDGMAFAVVGRR
jgi:hypothetical protein